MNRNSIIGVAALALALLLAGTTAAQGTDYTLDGAVSPGGAAALVSGAYTMEARLTQPGQAPAAGGDYSIGVGPGLPSAPRTERLYLPLLIR